MEMFERSQQPTLDRWSQGLLTEEEFLKEVDWDTTWGMDYELYKGILDAAKTHHLKVLCLNAPRDLVKKVAGNGMQGLSPEDRKMLPEMDLTNRQHRAYIATIYKSHEKGSAKDFENFYEAQCLWDEGMAESLSEFLKSSQAQGKTVFVFAAEKAGLYPGDQLVSVEGKEITKIKDIHHALEEKGWGNDITFTIIREGMEKKITVKLPPSED
jgi:uncharacterized iron-regulated protein